MNLLQGTLPEHSAWRAMVLFAPGEEPGAAWELGRALARTHGGELLAVVLCSDAAAATVHKAEETLSRALAASDEEENPLSFIVATDDFQAALRTFTIEADVDVLLAWADGPQWYRLDRLGCLVMAVRGDVYRAYREPEAGETRGEDGRALTTPTAPFRRVLIPTVGGPDTGLALTYLTRLTPDVELTTLYVAREDQGENAVALGRARLRQLLNFVDGSESINTKIVQASSPIAGIIDEANQGYDLVIMGASHESSLDRALFGDVVGEVVRQSKIPVVVAREGAGRRVGNFFRTVAWQLQRFVPRMNVSARTQAYVRIRRNARPTMDFFILIGLSAIIAAFGLLLSSPAVVIGAMLVAPLMSPIVGVGLAIVLGDTRFVRLTITTVVRGAALGLFVGVLAGLLPGEGGLTPEVMARTQPTLLDLGVALFSGIAGAYALCKSEAAGALPGVAIAAALVPPLASSGIAFATQNWAESFGALLLFTTNFIAIASAAALVFITLGFRPSTSQKDRRAVQLRSFRLAALFLGIIVVLLSATTFQLARASATTDLIFETVRDNANELENVEFDALTITSFEEGTLELDVTVRSTEAIGHSTVENLRDQIGADLQAGGVELARVALDMTVIRITKLDPEVPPTATPTPTPSNTPPLDTTSTPTATLTSTPPPTPTATPTSAPTVTLLPTETPTTTPTATATSTPTWTPTPTVPTAVVDAPFGLNLRAAPDPNSELLAFIPADSTLILLEAQEVVDGTAWQEVLFEGQTGWVLADFLRPSPADSGQ